MQKIISIAKKAYDSPEKVSSLEKQILCAFILGHNTK